MQVPTEFFIRGNNLQSFWKLQPSSQTDAYRCISERTLAQNKLKKDQDEELLGHRLHFHTRPGRKYPLNIPAQHRTDVERICMSARLVEQSMAYRSTMENRLKRRWLDKDTSGRPCHHEWVEFWNCDTDQTWMIPVTKGLRYSRYYLGHNKGDFIFQFKRPDLGTGLDSFAGSRLVDRTMFQFHGQVPRPQQEYLQRLEVVTLQVLQALLAIVRRPQVQRNEASQVKARRLFLLLKPEVKRWTLNPRMDGVPRDYFHILMILWNTLFPTGSEQSPFLQAALQSNTAIGEFAHLLIQLTNRARLFRDRRYRIVATCLERVAGTGLRKIAKFHYSRLEEAAFTQLSSGQHDRNIMIFEDSEIQDVHKFYREPAFSNDPLNPLFCTGRPDVLEVLKLAREIRDFDPPSEDD
ncbi:hypothetical protein BGZ63DRAFT_452355 [Mariannaea sp. PMI_226]|nr:hypothetical protein BGZ63DRAFT_452355 [Mariannaea sp. PMI_226]